MNRPLPEAVLALLHSHRSVRQFGSRVPEEDEVRAAVSAAQRAATSHLVQSYALLRVRCPQTRARLAELAGGQAHVREAGAFFCVLGDQRRHRRVLERRGGTYASNLEGFVLAAVDGSLFAQNLTLAFESMGYGTCYIGGLRNDAAAVHGLLGLPEGVFVLFGLCVGEPVGDGEPPPRLDLGAVLFEERYPEDWELDRAIDAYDQRVADWHARTRGKTGRDWSGQMARLFGSPQRDELASQYRRQGVRFDGEP